MPIATLPITYSDGSVLSASDLSQNFTTLNNATVPVASGGTNLTAGTSGGVLGFTATGTLASSAALAANGVVLGGGAGATPTATAAGAASTFFVGGSPPSFSTTPTASGLITGAGFTSSGNVAITPAAVSGTPAQHGLFQENVPKFWLRCGVAADITDSFNITSLADTGVGIVTVTLDRDFANTTYVVNGTGVAGTYRIVIVDATGIAAGSFQADCFQVDTNGTGVLTDPTTWMMVGFGDQ